MSLPFNHGPGPSRVRLALALLAVVMLCGATLWSVVGTAIRSGALLSATVAPDPLPPTDTPTLVLPPDGDALGPVTQGTTLLAAAGGWAAVIRFESPDSAAGSVDYRYWIDDATDGRFDPQNARPGVGGVRSTTVPEVMAGPIHLEWTGQTVEPFSHPACSLGPRAVPLVLLADSIFGSTDPPDIRAAPAIDLHDAALRWIGTPPDSSLAHDTRR